MLSLYKYTHFNKTAPVLGRTEGGEETKAARLPLSRPAIADSSHPSGMLLWSSRPKKRNGPWVSRAAAATRNKEKASEGVMLVTLCVSFT
ncbi:unnamed protein product [Lactuca virosa]|uniref:Uncharacterized protein n=1 Tax=Lactuca virosa TaxID=75947 RepID=A0AAU9PNL2_9ASTR|nr:unnamed protein product [Lactuca virosa]